MRNSQDLFNTIFVFIAVAVVLLIHKPTGTYALEDSQYLVCGPPELPCANLDKIRYPFWGSLLPAYCGHPGFKLNCSGKVAEITIMGNTYSVNEINYNERYLRVSRVGDWKDILCPADDLVNPSLDTTLFNSGSDTAVVVLYYNCQRSENLSRIFPFRCNSNQRLGSNYYAIQGDNHAVPVSCKENASVYASKHGFRAGYSSNLTEALNDEFALEWEANDSLCNDCQASGGRCGYNSSSGGFSCHCTDKSYPISCISDDEHYNNCTNFDCRYVHNISYPFWGGNQPAYCGHPDFKLDCSGSEAEITILSKNYRVLEINHTSQTLRVSFAFYGGTYVCPAHLPNNLTWRGSSFSEYPSKNQEFTIFYHCQSSRGSSEINTLYQCDSGNAEVFNFFLNSTALKSQNGALADVIRTCSGSVVVPVSTNEVETINSLDYALRAVGFWLEWKLSKNASRQCDDCRRSGGRCGHNTSSTEFSCHCRGGSYPITCGSYSGSSFKHDHNIIGSYSFKRSWVIGISGALSGIIIIMALIIYSHKKEYISSRLVLVKKDNKNEFMNLQAFIKSHGSFAPKQYTYAYVRKITNSFSEEIGKGGYGSVYKGKLSDGSLVAVKVLKESKTNGEEFFNEVASIGRTSHVNVVMLFGFCCERNKRALVYEYMPNGSLDKFIFNQDSENKNTRLEWKTMYDIACGIARGLEYLHRGCTTRILHFDIKPHNILLDKDFCPKISDFGLAKLCKRDDSTVSMLDARGTMGYVAPEVFCRNFGGVSYKSDVYSYGMMILEMVGGRKNLNVEVSRASKIYFPDWIHNHLGEYGDNLEINDEITNEEEEMIRKMILVSLWCIQSIPSNRPSMTKVVEMLEGSLESLQIPPKPSLSYPTSSSPSTLHQSNAY